MNLGSSSFRLRADIALVARGLAGTRSQAASLLMSGRVCEGDELVTKAGTLVFPERLRLKGDFPRFVGRGGDKLEGFFRAHPELSPEGKLCLDIGSSTGGFTDCLLSRKADYVVAVDVGTNQLDYRLRTNPRVLSFEQTDARELSLGMFERFRQQHPRMGEPFDLVVMDVSFISLKHVLPAVWPLVSGGGDVVCLVKPQFEAGPSDIPRGGVLKDPLVVERCLNEVSRFVTEAGWNVMTVEPSTLAGRDGNQEYFLWHRIAVC